MQTPQLSRAASRDLAGYDEISHLRQASDYDHALDAAAAALGTHPASILDLGCGTGSLLDRAAHRWPGLARRVGLDGSPTRVGEAQARLGGGVEIAQGDLRALPYRSERYDVIFMLSVLHWLYPDEHAPLAWAKEHLAPGGALVMTTHHPRVGEDGLGAEDVIVRDALAQLGIPVDLCSTTVPMSVRARPFPDVHALLASHADAELVAWETAPMRVESGEQHRAFHTATFGNYFSRLVGCHASEEEFLAALAAVADGRIARNGVLYDVDVALWVCRARSPRWAVR